MSEEKSEDEDEYLMLSVEEQTKHTHTQTHTQYHPYNTLTDFLVSSLWCGIVWKSTSLLLW